MSGIWSHTPIMVCGRESTRDSNATRLLSTLALAFLVESVVGQALTVLIFAVIVGISISVKVRRPLLLTLATAALAVNTLYLPSVTTLDTSRSMSLLWIGVWGLEGLLINALAVEILSSPGNPDDSSEVGRHVGKESRPDHEGSDLLLESSNQSQERVRLMVESIRDYAIVMLDPHGRVASWNVGAERILGYQASEILGRNHEQFHVPEDVGLKIPQRSLETAGVEDKFEVEGWRRRKDSTRLWARVGVSPVRSATGTLLGFATVIRDITEKKRAEESLRKANDELEIRVRVRTVELAEANRALHVEVLERIQAQEVLEMQSEVLRSILDSIGDAIVVTGERGEPWTLNTAARALFGIGPYSSMIEHDLNLEISNTADASDSSAPIQVTEGPISLALRGEEVDDLEFIVRPPGSDTCRWVLANARPLTSPSGRGRGAVVAFRDITEHRRYAQELKTAKEAAESASRAKDQFLATLSHELRTPLTPVLLAVTDLLEQSDLGAEALSTLAMIRRNAELEARLIDDLLDLTRATTGRLTLSIASVDLHHVIQDAAEICAAELAASQLELRLDLGATRHHLSGDSARLQQVFWNLIKNAVKFTPQGGRITIRTWNPPGLDSGQDSVPFLAEVSDTGIGIEPDHMPRIFKAFGQRDPEHQRIYGGLGLGLAISRSILEAHGGHLSANSAGKNRGAVFTIELMVGSCARSGAVTNETSAMNPASSPRPEGLRILLVDDNRDTLHYLAGVLQQRGYHVNPAFNFRTATKLAEANGYDLVISDIELPDGSGLDIMRDLRRSNPTPGIALSGFGTVDDVALSLDAGFAEHLIKPIDVRKLDAAIARVASGRGGKDFSHPHHGESLPEPSPFHPRPLTTSLPARNMDFQLARLQQAGAFRLS
jgi:PAS domain S-box-containing protein